MQSVNTNPVALAVVLALLLAGATAGAQEARQAPKANPAAEAELATAREALERAAKRVVELSRELGHEDQMRHAERRVVRKPVLGVLLAPDPQSGVRIAGVTPDSAAAKGGLRSGDRLISIDGQQVLGSSGELRVENARKLLGKLDTKTPVRVVYVRDGRNGVATVTPKLDQQVFLLRGDAPMAFGHETLLPPGMAPKIHRELIRIGPGGDCKGEDCKLPMLAEAFRWHGLNLASVNPQLGRYFGTDRGVLVLSTGPELAGLQAGDVIRKVDGKVVGTPREAMEALRAKPADSMVAIDYLRDRKPASAKMKVPEALPLRVPMPPMPPRPPKPPATPAPPAPPPPPPGTAFEFETGTFGDIDTIAFLPMPPDAPLPPEAPEMAEEIEIETY